MRRREFLPLAAAAAWASPPRRVLPNLLILYTDDQGIGDVGCYGQPEVRTPHIDALARGGVRFTQWYSNAPICSASRAALLTGKYPERTGVTGALLSSATRDIPGLRAGETTLAGELRAAGYRTAVIGKWHLGSVPHSRPTAQGFDEFFGWYSGWLDAYSHRYYRLGGTPSHIFHDLWRNDTEVFEEPAYMTELLGREALAFLNRQTLAKPFFLYLAFGAPHYAMMSPRKYQDRFPASMPRDRREHLAMVAAIDDVVGAILRTLERRRRLRDTIIFFASDNGATREERASHLGGPYDGGSNRPFRGWKQGLFEGGIRVPAILHAPTYLPPRVCEEVGIMMDILPTFLTLAERPVAPDVDGANLWPALRGEATWPRRPLFWAFSKSRALRDSDWKLLVNPPRHPGDPPPPRLWLSDLRDDPGELRNRVPEESERAARMERQIEEWGRSVGLS